MQAVTRFVLFGNYCALGVIHVVHAVNTHVHSFRMLAIQYWKQWQSNPEQNRLTTNIQQPRDGTVILTA